MTEVKLMIGQLIRVGNESNNSGFNMKKPLKVYQDITTVNNSIIIDFFRFKNYYVYKLTIQQYQNGIYITGIDYNA